MGALLLLIGRWPLQTSREQAKRAKFVPDVEESVLSAMVLRNSGRRLAEPGADGEGIR